MIRGNERVPPAALDDALVQRLEQQARQLEADKRALQREIAARARLEDALRRGEEEWRTLIEAMPQIVWITRPDGWHTHFNQWWMDFTGLSLEESLGHGWNPPFHPEDRDRAAARWDEAIRTGAPYEIEYRLRRADGTYHWMLGRAMPLRDDSGAIVKWFGTCTDIEELKRAEARIDAQARLLDQTQDAIVVHDLEQRVLYWNRSAERIHGWTADEAIGRTLEELIASDAAQLQRAMDGLLRDGEWSGELHYRTRSGRDAIMEGRWSLLRHDDGTPRAALAVNTDVTHRRRIEDEYLRALEARATQDPLTGLANRGLLFERLELLLGQRHRAGVAVAFLDLDGFKDVNDRLGHRTGDHLLVRVAERLRAAVRQGDVVARIGGDEFVVVGEATDAATALGLGERLAATVSGPTRVEGVAVTISASVGVAFVAPDDDAEADDVLSRADAVMYRVKRRTPGSAGLESPTSPTWTP